MSARPEDGTKPLGTLQVDVDELWVYREAAGGTTQANASAPVYDQGIPRLLDFLDKYGIRATFFICGRDLPVQREALREILRRGHELANHTTSHPSSFSRLDERQKRKEIAETHDLIVQASGWQPIGFKSPGYSFGPDQLVILGQLGYRYDSSIFTTPYAPALRSLNRLLVQTDVDPTRYGRMVHGLTPQRPYRPDPKAPHRPSRQKPAPEVGVWEVPVTTMPILRIPMHSTFTLTSGKKLFDVGLALSKSRGVVINYSLHAADLIDPVDDPLLASIKFLNQPFEEKRALYEHILGRLSETYRLLPTRELLGLHN
ncbi:MAG: polysaccharide deacetylase family protein [Chloroflexota bacterium]|nr:polysaccharide deacetylase family protein [Chloroflexota bacterium]